MAQSGELPPPTRDPPPHLTTDPPPIARDPHPHLTRARVLLLGPGAIHCCTLLILLLWPHRRWCIDASHTMQPVFFRNAKTIANADARALVSVSFLFSGGGMPDGPRLQQQPPPAYLQPLEAPPSPTRRRKKKRRKEAAPPSDAHGHAQQVLRECSLPSNVSSLSVRRTFRRNS